MNLQQLRYLVVVARLGTMTRAAQVLHIGQPALTQAIQGLEREVGTALFERTSRGVVPTEAGRMLVNGATRALAELDAAVGEVVATRAAARPTVVLATRPAAAIVPGIDLVRRLRDSRPEVVVRIVSVESADEVVDLVAAGEADLGLTDLAAPVPDLVAQEVATHRFLAFLPPGSRVRGDSIGPGELADFPLIGAPTDDRWRMVDRWFLGAGASGEVAVEVNRRDLVLPLVAAGLGATMGYSFQREEAERLGIVVVGLDRDEARAVWVIRSRPPLSDDAEHAWRVITAPDAPGSPDGSGSPAPGMVR